MAEALNNRKAKADDVVKYLLQNSLVSLNTMDMNQEQFTTMICNAFMHLKENTLLAYVLTDIDTPMWKNALMVSPSVIIMCDSHMICNVLFRLAYPIPVNVEYLV